jgi:hypothetical protein
VALGCVPPLVAFPRFQLTRLSPVPRSRRFRTGARAASIREASGTEKDGPILAGAKKHEPKAGKNQGDPSEIRM